MRLNRRAKQYGEALFNAAKEMGVVEEVCHSLSLVNQLLKRDASFRAFFNSRRIESDQKGAIVGKVLGINSHPLVSTLFGILSEKREYRLMSGIQCWVETRRQRELNLLVVKAYTAEELDEDEINNISQMLESSMAKQVEMSTEIDESLIGGIKLRMDNLFLDGSLHGQLERLKIELI
ncbi:MAG: ATP synthase F1 subunit delta [Candidatus Marinimicrobia bacterium]|jgi:F-type H+-transporting ATPase subunit delta|nr:ATP synthase F1 subunit delta [Candidatus Neomarinimicrobiota bacterium]|tara:strand:+ start:544 stop:1077 length:534 start_codon:yes stop_codon:yes gene_type:complete